jgi:hypothetical protein
MNDEVGSIWKEAAVPKSVLPQYVSFIALQVSHTGDRAL